MAHIASTRPSQFCPPTQKILQVFFHFSNKIFMEKNPLQKYKLSAKAFFSRRDVQYSIWLMLSLVWQMTEVLSCTFVTFRRITERTVRRFPSTIQTTFRLKTTFGLQSAPSDASRLQYRRHLFTDDIWFTERTVSRFPSTIQTTFRLKTTFGLAWSALSDASRLQYRWHLD